MSKPGLVLSLLLVSCDAELEGSVEGEGCLDAVLQDILATAEPGDMGYLSAQDLMVYGCEEASSLPYFKCFNYYEGGSTPQGLQCCLVTKTTWGAETSYPCRKEPYGDSV